MTSPLEAQIHFKMLNCEWKMRTILKCLSFLFDDKRISSFTKFHQKVGSREA